MEKKSKTKRPKVKSQGKHKGTKVAAVAAADLDANGTYTAAAVAATTAATTAAAAADAAAAASDAAIAATVATDTVAEAVAYAADIAAAAAAAAVETSAAVVQDAVTAAGAAATEAATAAATAVTAATTATAADTAATTAAAAATTASAALVESEIQRGKQEKLARTDGLTELGNQNGFFQDIDRELQMLARYRHPAALAVIDIDDFKDINDSLGHIEGNKFLRALGLAIRKSIRSTDIAGRIGGDEFAILFPETEPKIAKNVIEKLLVNLRKTMTAKFPDVTLSVGIAGYHTVPATSEIMLREADLLMYDIKKSGKNSIKLKVIN